MFDSLDKVAHVYIIQPMTTRTSRTEKGRDPKPGSLFPSQVLAENLKRARGARGLNQGDVAERMTALGHGWARHTVGEVERHGRTVTTDELLGLAATLAVSVVGLLDPAMTHGLDPPDIDLGLPEHTPPFKDVVKLLVGFRVHLDDRLPFDWPNAQVIWSPKNHPGGYVTGKMTAREDD